MTSTPDGTGPDLRKILDAALGEAEDPADDASLEIRVAAALKILVEYGPYDGGHHKMWVIDQAVRRLTGPLYEQFITEICDGEDGPETYEWDTGITP